MYRLYMHSYTPIHVQFTTHRVIRRQKISYLCTGAKRSMGRHLIEIISIAINRFFMLQIFFFFFFFYTRSKQIQSLATIRFDPRPGRI